MIPYKPVNIQAAAFILAGAMLTVASGLAVFGPILVPAGYFEFADERMALGIPNFADVVSNAPFLAVGMAGAALTDRARRYSKTNPALVWSFHCFFASIGLTAAGSAYFHLAPDAATILPDRAPIALAGAALFAILTIDRLKLSTQTGFRLLAIAGLYAFAAVSVAHVTGDLRLYVMLQVSPILAGLILTALAKHPGAILPASRIIAMIALYGAAKATEVFDTEIYQTLGVASGHTLKHCLAALAVCCVFPSRVTGARSPSSRT